MHVAVILLRIFALTNGAGDSHRVEEGVLEPPHLLARVRVDAGLDGLVQLVLERH